KLGGTLGQLRLAGDITGKANELTTLLAPMGIAAQRLLVVGLGKRANADRPGLIAAAAAATRAVTRKQPQRIAFALPGGVPQVDWDGIAMAVCAGVMQGAYGPGVRKSEPSRFVPNELGLVAPPTAPVYKVQEVARRGEVEGRGVWTARELVNLPPCDLYPESFAQTAVEVASLPGLECTVLDEKQIEAERMGSLLAVARGSDRPPRVVVLRYRRGADGRT